MLQVDEQQAEKKWFMNQQPRRSVTSEWFKLELPETEPE